jgi:hypothetical protein
MNTQDGNYDYTKPWRTSNDDGPEPGPRYDYMGPFASKEEEIITRALVSNTIPGVQLADVVRPPLPQIQLFPPKTGYRTRQIGIKDLRYVDELFTGPPVRQDAADQGYQGTMRYAQDNNSW